VGVALLHDGKGALWSCFDATLLHQKRRDIEGVKKEMKK
jgi:hypothetical protein